jgi:hypothetical protein
VLGDAHVAALADHLRRSCFRAGAADA